jgi:hypothetical protein
MAMTRLTNKSTEELLELLLVHMQNMDRRDYWRTIGGFFKGVLTLIPMILFLVSTWYIYAYRDTILQQITTQVTTQMQSMMPTIPDDDFMEKIKPYLPKPQSSSSVSSRSK